MFAKNSLRKWAITCLLCYGAMAEACAGVITIGFDEFPDDTVITNQYQSFGITVSGVRTFIAAQGAVDANTPPNTVYSPDGKMAYVINRNMDGDIVKFGFYFQTVSPVEVTYLNSSGLLIGQQALLPDGLSLKYFEFDSPSAIARIDFVGLGSNYTIDTLKFFTRGIVEVPEPGTIVVLSTGMVLLACVRRRSNKACRQKRAYRM